MASEAEIELTGVHFVRTTRGPLGSRWQVYAWRGGPSIMSADQILKPKLTAEALGRLVAARQQSETPATGDTFPALVEAYLASPEFLTLEDYTRRDYRVWADRAKEKWKDSKAVWFDEPRMRGEIIKWRDQWAHSPRQRKYATQVLSVILSWGAEQGWIATNAVRLLRRRKRGKQSTDYKANRAEILWTPDEIEAVAKHMPAHTARVLRLAAWTGLPRGDLVALRWSEVGDLYISRGRNKTSVQTTIPIFDQTRALLDEFKAARAAHKVKSIFVVTSRTGGQLKPRGLGIAVERAKKLAGVSGKTLNDVRGTFATRLMDLEFTDKEIDSVLGWETGKSERVRDFYISRRNIVIAAIKRVQKKTGKGET